MRFKKTKIVLAMLAAFAAFAAYTYSADESVGAYFTILNDGSCERALPTVETDYSRTGGSLEARATVRSSPFGGDCNSDALSYNLWVERQFDVGSGVGVLFKFQSSKNPLTALYALSQNQMVLRRADSAPLLTNRLPAGNAQVVNGIVGLSRAVPLIGELDVGINVAKTPFSDGQEGRTLHMALNRTLGIGLFGIELNTGVSLDFDANGHDYGAAYAVWSRGSLTCKFDGSWGLNELGDGLSAFTTIRGTEWAIQGAARDWRASGGCGIRFGL